MNRMKQGMRTRERERVSERMKERDREDGGKKKKEGMKGKCQGGVFRGRVKGSGEGQEEEGRKWRTNE